MNALLKSRPLFLLLAAFAGTGLAQPGLAADGHEAHHHATPAAPVVEAPLTEGIIKKVDKAAGKVTLSHGPLPNGMPAMTMPFRVKDAAWLDRMQEGRKIRFAVESIDGALTVVRFEPVK